MAVRLMQIFLPRDRTDESEELLEGREVFGRWRDDDSDQSVLHLLVPAEETEEIMDQFEQRFAELEGFHVVLSPVEAVLPRIKAKLEAETEESPDNVIQRISREELYAAANDSLGINRVFLGLVILSAVVAAIGLKRDDVAVIIGAMVMAPLLGPNVAMALATTLGDFNLMWRSFLTNVVGVGTVFLFAVLVGLLFPADPHVPAIASRISTNVGDVLLAFAAGMAGTLAFSRGQSGAVIGVMVAVALVPPLVVCGMLFGTGHFHLAIGALLLTAGNIISINLAGVITFLAQGVRPRNVSEEARAKQAIRNAVLTWTVLLAVLVTILWFNNFGLDV